MQQHAGVSVWKQYSSVFLVPWINGYVHMLPIHKSMLLCRFVHGPGVWLARKKKARGIENPDREFGSWDEERRRLDEDRRRLEYMVLEN